MGIGYTLLCGFLPFNGCCGEDCGWNDRNEECSRCQEDLFNSIKRGSLHFPDQYWSKISKDAKDLLINLLQKDPNDRLEAADILNHPWIIQMTSSSSNIENENNNNNNNISEQQQQKVILANDNQIDTTTSTSSPNNEDNTVNKQLLSDVNKQLTSSAANNPVDLVVHFDI